MSFADKATFKSVGNRAPGKDHTMRKAAEERRLCKCKNNVQTAGKSVRQPEKIMCTVLKKLFERPRQ